MGWENFSVLRKNVRLTDLCALTFTLLCENAVATTDDRCKQNLTWALRSPCIFSFRCPKYENVPSTCSFVADPRDPQCCRVPQCQDSTGTSITGFTGSFTGYGRPNDLDLSSISSTGYSRKCFYLPFISEDALS